MSRFGVELARRLGEASLRPPDPFIRLQPGEEPPEGCEPTEVAGCFRVTGSVPEGVRRQDIGAQTVVPLLDLQPDQHFLDVCAAPGNKTAQALETPGLKAIACDSSEARLAAFHASGAELVRLDASRALPFAPVFDRILVDAPCSGTGTLARNPEIRWRPGGARPAQARRAAAQYSAECAGMPETGRAAGLFDVLTRT